MAFQTYFRRSGIRLVQRILVLRLIFFICVLEWLLFWSLFFDGLFAMEIYNLP